MSRQGAQRYARLEVLVVLWGFSLVCTGWHGVLGAATATTVTEPANTEKGPTTSPSPQSSPLLPAIEPKETGESQNEAPLSTTTATTEPETRAASPSNESPPAGEDAEPISTPLFNDSLDEGVGDALDAMDDAAVMVEERLEGEAEEDAERAEMEAQQQVDAVEKAVEKAQEELEEADRRADREEKDERRRSVMERLQDDSDPEKENSARTRSKKQRRGNRKGKGGRNKRPLGRNNARSPRPGRGNGKRNRGIGQNRGGNNPRMSAKERKEKRMKMMQNRSLARLVKFLEKRLSFLEKAVPEENRNEEMFNVLRYFLAQAKELMGTPKSNNDTDDADTQDVTTAAPTSGGETSLSNTVGDVSDLGSGESPSENVSPETARILRSLFLRRTSKLNP